MSYFAGGASRPQYQPNRGYQNQNQGQRRPQPSMFSNPNTVSRQEQQEQADRERLRLAEDSAVKGIADASWMRTYTAVALPTGTVVAWAIGDQYKTVNSIEALEKIKIIIDKRQDVYRKKFNSTTKMEYMDKDGYFGGWDDVRDSSMKLAKVGMARAIQAAQGRDMNALFWGTRPLTPDSYYPLGSEGFQLWLWQFVQLNVIAYDDFATFFAQEFDNIMKRPLTQGSDTRGKLLANALGLSEPPTGNQLIDLMKKGNASDAVLKSLAYSLVFIPEVTPSILYEIGKIAYEDIPTMLGGESAKFLARGSAGHYMLPGSQILDRDFMGVPDDALGAMRNFLHGEYHNTPGYMNRHRTQMAQDQAAQLAQELNSGQFASTVQPQVQPPQGVQPFPQGGQAPQGTPFSSF